MMTETIEREVPEQPRNALIVSVLIFVGIFLWGLILSISEMAKKHAPPPSAAAPPPPDAAPSPGAAS